MLGACDEITYKRILNQIEMVRERESLDQTSRGRERNTKYGSLLWLLQRRQTHVQGRREIDV